MNERILELADKAIEDMPGAWNIPDEFCKKFAELIVAECCEIVGDYYGNHNKSGPLANTMILEIREHFGVEE